MIALQPCSLRQTASAMSEPCKKRNVKRHYEAKVLRLGITDISLRSVLHITKISIFCITSKNCKTSSRKAWKIITFRVGRKRRNVHMISLTFLVAACIATINKVFCTKYASISPNCCIWSLIHKVHYCLPFSRVWRMARSCVIVRLIIKELLYLQSLFIAQFWYINKFTKTPAHVRFLCVCMNAWYGQYHSGPKVIRL